MEIEKTKESVIDLIRALMQIWDISIHEIFETEGNNKKIIIVDKDI